MKIEKLRLLALIARRQKEFNNVVDEDLINLINDLYKLTDFSSVGAKIYDIVSDLIYAIPNIAIEMIEKTSGSASEKNINDWIIAKLSIAAINSNTKDEDNSENERKLEAIQNINNPSVRKINRAISFLVGNYSSLKVIEEVNKLSDSKEKLRLLRLWLNNNKANTEKIEQVIHLALNELISISSESTITLDILKDLSYQLPYVKDVKIRKELLARFILIENDILDPELSKNKYIYKLNIFHTYFSIDKKNPEEKINSILNEIDNIDDNLIKLESYAEVYSKLYIFHEEVFTDKIKFTYSRILSISNEILNNTANHFKICQNMLTTISKINPILGLKIANNINTCNRRESARLLILDSYLDNNLKFVKIELLKEIEKSFEYEHSKLESYSRILERYSEAKSLHYEIIKSLLYFINKINSQFEPNLKLKCHLFSYIIIVKNIKWKETLSNLFENLIFAAWQSIEADWERVDKGFKICSSLSKVNEEFSKKIYIESLKIKEESWIDSRAIAYTYINSVKLIIRTYNGLLISGNDTKNDFKILKDLLGRIPSEVEKLKLWTEIGINSYISNRFEISKEVYNNHVLPLIQGIINNTIEINSVINSIIFIHFFNSDLAIEYLKQYPPEIIEEAYSNICDFYITKQSPYEVYDSAKNIKYSCSFDDIMKAVNLIKLIDKDSLIYSLINLISESINNNKNTIVKAQISTIVGKLKEVISNKLPDPKNIKHDGYKIISLLKLSLLNKEKIDWFKIVSDTENINNLSDIIFIKSVIIDSLTNPKNSSEQEIRKNVINDIIKDLNSFNVHYEFVQRVIDISETMYKVEKSKWKEVINKAFSLTNSLVEGSEVYESKKNLIDTIHRMDPMFAKEMLKTIDRGNKLSFSDSLIKDYFETLEISNKIKNNKDLDQKEKENYKYLVKGIYKALAALNSEKIGTRKIEEISKYLSIGNKLPLQEVFPVYMYYLNNCAKTYKSKNLSGFVSTLHRDNFSEAVTSTNLVHLLSQKRKLKSKILRQFFIDEEFVLNKPVKPENREEALEFIRNWLKDNLEEYIIIVDSYLKKEDLEIIKLIMDLNKDIEIDFLGCIENHNFNIEDEFRLYWKKISDENPPFVNITFCWNTEDLSNKPIHDRWIITKNSGLRLGTSISSLGMKRESEISVMRTNETLNIFENTIKEYISMKKREINKQRLAYKSFSL